MKKFEEGLKQKAHLSKIRQAKTTIGSTSRHSSKLTSSKVGAQAQLLLDLYDKKNYDSIPAYKLLRTAGLQQYTRGFIQRGYGINLGKLSMITEDQKKKLYQDLKILPGHTVKLDRIIETLAKSSYSLYGNDSYDVKQEVEKEGVKPEFNHLKITGKDIDYEKQLERVLNQYTPQSSDQKKKTFNTKYSDKKVQQPSIYENKLTKTKYSVTSKDRTSDFKKKPLESSTKPTVKKSATSDSSKKQSLARLLKNVEPQTKPMSSKKVMEINLQIDKVKALNKSFDGALMSSTIANIDIEELIYAFSGFITARIIAAPEPKTHFDSAQKNRRDQEYEDIEDQVGEILKESFLHPLYKHEDVEVQEELAGEEEVYSQGEEDQPEAQISQRNQFTQEKTMMESSFLGGGVSVNFGLSQPLKIFDQPEPTTIDYFKPTVDSVANFIKNIVLTAKMQRQIPIMAASYLDLFQQKSKIILTSINYKRILVTVLLLASKIWDDESFETPSFAKSFPQYSTVLLNQMEKQVVKALDYRLKIDKKEYTKIYFQMRKHTKENVRSYQNRKLTVKRIRQLQAGVKKDYKAYFMTKRNSH